MYYIIQKYKPHIYVSEWFCGRNDCACYYKLSVAGNGAGGKKKPRFHSSWSKFVTANIDQWSDPRWEKVIILLFII